MRGAFPALLFLSACSRPDPELVALKGAHSVVAEWAAVARQEAAGRISETYTEGMRQDAQAQLASERRALAPNEPATRLIVGLGEAPNAAQLAETAAALGRLEDAHEGR